MNSFWMLISGIIIGAVGTIILTVFYVTGEKGELEDYDLTELTEEEKKTLREKYKRMEE